MNRRTLSMAGGACAVLLVAWFALLWSPKGAQLASARERQETAEATAAELEVKVARLQDSLRRSPELQADLDRVRSAVPSSADLPQFILDVDDAAAKAGVEFLSVTPTRPALGAGGPTEVKLALAIEGDYQPVLDFLDQVLRMRRLIVIDSVAVTPDGSTSSLSITLYARMFTTEAPPLPAGSAPVAPTPTTEAPQS